MHWASDHRNHHRLVDQYERDPYSAGRGFWFSHMAWILRKHESSRDDFSNVKDLMANPVVRYALDNTARDSHLLAFLTYGAEYGG